MLISSRNRASPPLACCLFCSSGPFPPSLLPRWTFNSSVHLLASSRHFSMTNSRLSSDRTHYHTLGLPWYASQADIKEAFYRLSKKYHPDVNNSSTANSEGSVKKFLEIREAYDTLRDEQKRREYDQQHNIVQGIEQRLQSWRVQADQRTAESHARNKSGEFDPDPFGFGPSKAHEFRHHDWSDSRIYKKPAERMPFSDFGEKEVREQMKKRDWSDPEIYRVWRAMAQEAASGFYQAKREFQQPLREQHWWRTYERRERLQREEDEERRREQAGEKRWWESYVKREQKLARRERIAAFIHRTRFVWLFLFLLGLYRLINVY